jgi:NMD protein affecting ribosome stability and mRNA decay
MDLEFCSKCGSQKSVDYSYSGLCEDCLEEEERNDY